MSKDKKIDTSRNAYNHALADYLYKMPALQQTFKEFTWRIFVQGIEDGQISLPHPQIVGQYMAKFPTYEEWKQNLCNIHTLRKVGKIIGHAESFKPKTR